MVKILWLSCLTGFDQSVVFHLFSVLTETKNADAMASCYRVAITKKIISAIIHRTKANKASIKSSTKVINVSKLCCEVL